MRATRGKKIPLARRRLHKCRGGLLLWLLCLAAAVDLCAQQPFSNRRSRCIDARLVYQQLDSLSIAPPLLYARDSASGQALALSLFVLENNFLRVDTAGLRRSCPVCERICLDYRVLPLNLGARTSRLDTAAIRRAGQDNAIEFDYAPYAPAPPLLGSAGLVSNGSYTRGLSFGNSQNLVFNSNLNLQLEGKLGNDLEIKAALSDNSVPLQPDGTTRQLNEFDRIFIQLKRKNTTLSAGDFDLLRPQGYFSNYFKRLQGADLQWTLERRSKVAGQKVPAAPRAKFHAAAAISRGKFARQTIQGQEGNQGPYRLQGAEGERFIIVLAGTEKVFIDGQLLRRGLDDDYVIDYNLGEVSFTARRLVTKDSRIIVEFEYAVQAYLRSTVATNVEWIGRRGRAYLNVYAEQDSRNSAGGQELSAEERRRLAEAGDMLQNAYASGIDTLADGLEANRVLYKSLDTLVCGMLKSVLAYSTSRDSARYAARFTEVGQGQGNYVQLKTAANGRVFRWVAPDPLSCQPQGNFEPIVRLLAPESRQLHTLGADYKLGKNTNAAAELALSGRDLNRFSPLGNGDNFGSAGFFSLRQNMRLGRDSLAWQGQLNASYEFAQKTFLPLNPYRPAEFARDWNVETGGSPAAEQWLRSGFTLQKPGWGSARYEFGAFIRQSKYDGARHLATLRLQRRGFDVLAEANLLQTGGLLEETRFSRPRFEVSKLFFRAGEKPLFKLGLYGERERNERSAAGADTLSRASFWYDLLRFYFQTPENQGSWQFGGSLMQRNDYFPVQQLFKGNTIADELNLNGAWGKAGNAFPQRVAWNFTWRKLRILDAELTTLAPQNTYLGRVDYNFSGWKNAVALTTGYEVGSGQSPRVEFNYVQVNPGEGLYTWVDRNRDSTLQVDEMEIAVFLDQANFIRVAVTTPDYVRTNNVAFNQNLRLEPRLLWAQSPKRWRRSLSRFSTQSTLQINRRVYADVAGASAWNPFELAVADSALVTVQASIRNVLFVNRAQPGWDASLTQSDSRNRVALTTGFESRRNADWTLHGRLNLGQRWSAEAELLRGQKKSDNEAFASRDFDIRFWEAGPKLSWLPTRVFRIIFKLNWQDSRNTLAGAEKALQSDWNAELTWNPVAKTAASGFRAATSLRVKGTFVNIRYEGQPNTPVAFAMLEGLQDGRNFLWSLNLDRQLSKAIQLNLNYEGRKTGAASRIVHVGRAQVRAIF